MRNKIILFSFIALTMAIFSGALILSFKKNRQIDSELMPLMAEFTHTAKTTPYAVTADGALDYKGALDDILDKRNSVLEKHNCLPGEWLVEETKKGAVRISFKTYLCPFNPFRKETISAH